MPILSPPPSFFDEVKPKKEIPEYTPPFGLTAWEDKRRVDLFLNVPSWKCKCGITNFGRNLRCVGFTCKKPPCMEVRPAEWKPLPWEYSL